MIFRYNFAKIACPPNTTVIKIENDKSISRKHAKLEIKLDGEALLFCLTDESKYSSKIKFGSSEWQKILSDDSSISRKMEFSPDFKAKVHFGVYDPGKFEIYGQPLKIVNPCELSDDIFRNVTKIKKFRIQFHNILL